MNEGAFAPSLPVVFPNSMLSPDSYFSVFEPQTLSTIAALLRLGDKYDMKVLHRDALRILHSGSPLELSTAPPLGTLFPQVIRRDGPAFGFDLVNVLYENAMEILLPVALYVLVCALNDIKDIFDGVDRADGTRAGLHPEVLRAAAVGYHKLTKRAEQLLFTWPLQCAKTCASQSCADQRLEFMEEVVEHSLSSHVIFVSMSWKIHPLVDSCQECTTFGRSEHKAGRKILWEEMPSTFGIQKSWADLQSDYAAVRCRSCSSLRMALTSAILYRCSSEREDNAKICLLGAMYSVECLA